SGQTCRGHNGSSWSQKEAAPPPKITLQTGGGQFIGNAQEQGQSCAPVVERPTANYDKEAGDHLGLRGPETGSGRAGRSTVYQSLVSLLLGFVASLCGFPKLLPGLVNDP